MKNILSITTFYILMLLLGCKNPKRTEKEVTIGSTEKSKDNKIDTKTEKPTVKVDRKKNLKTKYVLAKNGLFYRKNPNGIIIDKFPYGKKLEIIGYSGQKMIVEDNEKKISGEWVEVKIDGGNLQNKAYVFDGFLGDISEIELIKNKLCLVQGFYSSYSKTLFYENGEEIYIDSLLTIEILDKNTFGRLKQNNVDFINKDSTHIIKTKDTLFVNSYQYINKLMSNDGDIKYDYVGKIDFLDKYIIHRYLWENADYILVNESNGKIDSENQKLIERARSNGMNRLGLPRVSNDKKLMITLESAIYTKKAELNV